MKPDWRGEKVVVYENPWNRVLRQEVAFGDRRKIYINTFGPRCGIVLVRDGKILLVRQYRLLPDAMTVEIPGGAIEASEQPEQAAIRECEQETGWRCRTLAPLVTYYPGLDNVDNRTAASRMA